MGVVCSSVVWEVVVEMMVGGRGGASWLVSVDTVELLEELPDGSARRGVCRESGGGV